MSFKTFLFMLLFCKGIAAKSQTLLNADSSQIKKQILSQGGILMGNRLTHDDIESPGYQYMILYKFSKSTFDTNGINMMIFYLTLKNKCYKYLVSYVNDNSYIYKLKDIFDKPNSGLKQVKDSLKWINPVKKYIVRILPSLLVNGKKSPTFLLEIKNE